MKGNWFLWGAPLTICLLLIGGNIGKPGNNSNKQLDACNLQTGQTGILRGTVIGVGWISPGSSTMLSTVMTPSGCEVVVSANPWKLEALGNVNNKVEFTATVSGEFLTNPKNIKINNQIPDENGNVEPLKSVEVNIKEKPAFAALDKEAILTVWLGSKGYDKNFVISREMSARLKVGERNTLYYNDQSEIVQVEN